MQIIFYESQMSFKPSVSHILHNIIYNVHRSVPQLLLVATLSATIAVIVP